MIIATMSHREIMNQLEKDIDSLCRKAHVFTSIKHGEMMRKHLKYQTVRTKYKTGTSNEWNIISKLTKEDISSMFYLESDDSYGKVVYQISHTADIDDILLVKYNTHFFTRYREREEIKSGHPSQIIRRFFKNNPEVTTSFTGIKKDLKTLLVHYTFKEGIGLGEMDIEQGITTLKTYLPHRLLSESQKTRVQDMLEQHEQLAQISQDDEFWDRFEKKLTEESENLPLSMVA